METMTEPDCLLSRQPIYGSTMKVEAYELRSHLPDEMKQTIFGICADANLDVIVGEHQGLVYLTSEALADGLWKGVSKSRVMFGYQDNFAPSDAIASQLCEVAANGYRLTLSGKLSPESLALLNSPAHTVKLDVTSFMPDELEKRVAELRNFKLKIMAEKVDTYDDLEFCKALEFDFYQGHFLCRPAPQKQKVPVNRFSTIRLLSKLQDAQIPIPEVEQLVSQNVSLSYKLLRYANSASVALPRTVNSIGHAVRLIGMDKLRAWASALLLSSVDDKPRELITIALVRARMCELLAKSVPDAQKESFLSAGLLSVLDALLNCPMEEAVSDLPLAEDIKRALVSGCGPIGQALRCTIAYERADWDDVQFYGLAPAPIRDNYLAAIAWTRQLSNGLLN